MKEEESTLAWLPICNNCILVMCIVRNIGAWLSHSNTLFVLDCTIFMPMRSIQICEELDSIFSMQIDIFGYKKEVSWLVFHSVHVIHFVKKI